MRTAIPSAFGKAISAERQQRKLDPERFAELCDVSLSVMKQWEYGRRGISNHRAARLARKLGLPGWHFEQALVQDRMDAICTAREVTAVVVGLARFVEARLPGEQWAAVRAMLIGGV